jgi:surface antigen
MPRLSIGVLAVSATLLAACAGDPDTGTGPRENTGTLLGAVGGALLGSQFGGGAGGHVAGAVVGAAVGGLIGNRIGAALDEEDRRRAYAAEVEALDEPTDAPVEWRSPRTGYYGRVVPGRVYYRRELKCRPYTHTIYINGRPEVARGDACRNPDGTWTPVS